MNNCFVDAKIIGQKLTRLRGNHTQQSVADAVGVGVSAIANYERGTRVPRDEIKIRLANYFGVSCNDLFFDANVTFSDH